MNTTLSPWTPETLRAVSAELEGGAPEDVLLWGLDHFDARRTSPAAAAAGERAGLAMATGFGPEGVVLMHMLANLAPDSTVFYTDTDLLFDETYALRDQ